MKPQKKPIQKKSDIGRHYNFIKGRIAEAIVERLFIGLGMLPAHNGYEFRHPDIAHLRRTGQLPKDFSAHIEFGCDFIVRSSEKNEQGHFDLYSVEVKFSRDGRLGLEKIKNYQDEKLIFILVGLDGFWCASLQELIAIQKETKKKVIEFSALTPFQDHPAFKFSFKQKNTIEQFALYIDATLRPLSPHKVVMNGLIESEKKQALSILFGDAKK